MNHVELEPLLTVELEPLLIVNLPEKTPDFEDIEIQKQAQY